MAHSKALAALISRELSKAAACASLGMAAKFALKDRPRLSSNPHVLAVFRHVDPTIAPHAPTLRRDITSFRTAGREQPLCDRCVQDARDGIFSDGAGLIVEERSDLERHFVSFRAGPPPTRHRRDNHVSWRTARPYCHLSGRSVPAHLHDRQHGDVAVLAFAGRA